METTVEFLRRLGVSTSSDGRRRWPDAVKARIVAETLLPGATVNAVARKYDVRANHVSSWRRMAKDGELVLPVLGKEAAFAPLVVFDSPPAPPPSEVDALSPAIEIVAGEMLIKLDGTTPAARVAQIVRALGETA
ncbi:MULTISPECIES: IS66-like element accessory protein TnpA [Roseobacteraceae]|jgi:transposase|uniref:Transposase n=2 Tax=Roseobacteraceae TaxID=2854170 RepID=A0A0P1FAR2_9RHOB|nr:MULTISPECIES: transposase [Roseobacteraceae]AUR01454.1 Transposase [Phaeobacter inhibens]CRL15232.1 Transposase [Phaeobacter italicus]CUH51744.1 Transposase [Shimia marina]SFE24944.1 transposase [Shimia marina]SFH66453.1 transposase [Phaeobacter italicus]